MANENENKSVEEKVTPPAEEKKDSVDEFLEAAKKAREKGENSVSRDEFDELKNQNKKLMDFILEGGDLPDGGKKPQIPDIAELQKVRHNPDVTNLDIVSASLGLREQIIATKGYDPFALKEEEAGDGKKVAEALQKIVDESKGDPKTFNYLLERSIAEDDSALMNALKKRRKA